MSLEPKLSKVVGLTRSAALTLEGLMAGKPAEEIATELNLKTSTVQQLRKDIMAKMGANTQQQLIASVYAMSLIDAGAVNLAMPLVGSDPAPAQVLDTGTFGFHRFGVPGGIPVMLIHGAIFGISGHAPLRNAAKVLGLDIIAIERPGYGKTPMRKDDDPVDLACQHMTNALDALQISRAIVLCHDIGTLFAVRLAQHIPDRVIAIIAAPTTPPMQGWSQTNDMPTRHRAMAWTAQNFPAVMDKFVGLGLSQIAQKGVEALPKLVFDGCYFDQDVLMGPDMAQALKNAFEMAWAQEGAGFRKDMRLTNLDWQVEIAKVKQPVFCLHGDKSQTVSRHAVMQLARDFPNGHFIEVSGAGHSMPLSHTAYILRETLLVAHQCGLAKSNLVSNQSEKP